MNSSSPASNHLRLAFFIEMSYPPWYTQCGIESNFTRTRHCPYPGVEAEIQKVFMRILRYTYELKIYNMRGDELSAFLAGG